MNLRFTEEQEMMRKMVRDFAENEIAPFVERMEKGEFPREILRKMGELGLMGIPVPEKYGGAEMDFVAYIIAINEISRVSATVGVILSVHTSVGTNPILYFGCDEQKQRFLPKLASGEYLAAFCLTEAGSGSDAKSMKSRAVKKDDHYVINGSKMFTTGRPWRAPIRSRASSPSSTACTGRIRTPPTCRSRSLSTRRWRKRRWRPSASAFTVTRRTHGSISRLTG